MRRLCLLILAACGGAPPEPVHVSTPVVAPAVAAAAAGFGALTAAPMLDEVTVKARSHEFFDAIDRADVAAATAALSPTFVWFEYQRFKTRDSIDTWLHHRIDTHAPLHSRKWNDERVFLGGNSAVFIGEAAEHVPSDGSHPEVDQDGSNTLVWVYDGSRWQIVSWQWSLGGLEGERQVWNNVFRSESGFKLAPNQLLIDTVKGRKPGAALDLLMGQGRNAVYLASQGWRVTGVDISDEGLRIAREAAAKQKLKLDAIEADVDKWDLGTNKWDLVTMIYAGDDTKLVERIKPSLKHGGLFILEYFHAESDASKSGAGGWTTGQLAALFDAHDYKILRDEVVDDVADYSLRKQKLVRFVVQKL